MKPVICCNNQYNPVACVVGCIGHCSPETLPALIAALEDGSPGVRARAAFALCQLYTCFMIVEGHEFPSGGFPEPRCKAAVPALCKALDDTDSQVRRVAVMALQQIDAGAAAKAGVRAQGGYTSLGCHHYDCRASQSI
jgi:hypothetical protein